MSASAQDSAKGNESAPAQSTPNPANHDIEKGDPEAEKQRNKSNASPGTESDSINEDDVYNEPDEYARLLKYIDLEAKKEKHYGEEEGEEEEEGELTRVWYAPWKKRRTQSDEHKKVPQAWLETEMLKGLSEEDINKRRSKFGYNELERFVFSLISLTILLLSAVYEALASILSYSSLDTSEGPSYTVCLFFALFPKNNLWVL
jgi:H+-transporting ATPase